MATATATRTPAKRRRAAARTRWRTPLLLLAAFRLVLSVVAIPLAPGLFHDHFVVLVLLRPTKDVLLAGGFLVRRGDISLVDLALASVPLLLFGVWHFFALGRLYGDDIERDRMPKPARRLLPRDKIRSLCKVLEKRGAPLVVLGRLAVLPSTVVAAAAGASGMPAKRFLAADGVGGLLSFVEVVGAGYALGEAYEHAGPWLTGAGVAVLAVVLVLLGRWLRRA